MAATAAARLRAARAVRAGTWIVELEYRLMIKSKYKPVQDNQEVEIEEGVGLNFACCDCGLVHDLQVRRDGEKIFVSFKRDNRRTAALRRHYIMPAQIVKK